MKNSLRMGNKGNQEVEIMKCRLLCMANGDEYSDVSIPDEEVNNIKDGFIHVEQNGKTIMLNPEFILSIESARRSRNLSVT